MVWLTGRILRLVSPKFGKLVNEESHRKGYLRYVHSRIITNAEEIAFYGGQEVEQLNLKRAYKSLVKQNVTIFNQKLWYVMLEQFLMKYGWAGSGMVVMAIPIFTSQNEAQGDGNVGDNIADRTEYYTTAKNLLGKTFQNLLKKSFCFDCFSAQISNRPISARVFVIVLIFKRRICWSS